MKLIMRHERWSVSRRGRRFPARSAPEVFSIHERAFGCAISLDCRTQQKQLFAFKQKVNSARGCVIRHNNKSDVKENLCVSIFPANHTLEENLRRMSAIALRRKRHRGKVFSLLSRKFYF